MDLKNINNSFNDTSVNKTQVNQGSSGSGGGFLRRRRKKQNEDNEFDDTSIFAGEVGNLNLEFNEQNAISKEFLRKNDHQTSETNIFDSNHSEKNPFG